MSKEHYFVAHKFNNSEEVISFIEKPDQVLLNLKLKLPCQFKAALDPSKFKKINRNIIPELSSPNSDSEVRYLNATIKLLNDEPFGDDILRNLELRDYDNIEKEFNLKYKIEKRTLYLVIPDKVDL